MDVAGNSDKKNIVFFDGICSLCNGFIDFIVRFDRRKVIHISTLQGVTAESCLSQEQIDTLDSVIYLRNGVKMTKSTAVLNILIDMNRAYFFIGVLFLIPRGVRDFLYSKIAKHRYSIFGKKSSCRIPSEKEKTYFLP